MRKANRLAQIPPYFAFEIDRKKREALNAGIDVIDLGVGDPDQPTPGFVVEAMARAIRDPRNHTYALGAGVRDFRQAAVDSMVRRFGVQLDPMKELVPLIGSKDAIAHLPLAFVNPGDHVLVPDPGYPAYLSGCILAGGVPWPMPMSEDSGWLPRLRDVPSAVADSARMLYLNYPNNPTGAVAPLSFFRDAVAFAQEHDILLVHDAPYIDNWFDEPAPSVLQVPEARQCAIELHSLSKSYNMTGWRIGFAVGNAEAIKNLAFVKSNVDSGPFKAVQWAAAEAMREASGTFTRTMNDLYRRRRDLLAAGLAALGLRTSLARGAFYLWARCPAAVDSLTFANRLLEQAAVTVFPGVGFGAAGEGWFRMSLTVSENRLHEALERMKKVL